MLVLACGFACPTYDILFFPLLNHHHHWQVYTQLLVLVWEAQFILWLEFCLGSPFLTVWCCSTWSFRVPNSSSTLFSPKIEIFEVSFGSTCEVVGSTMDSLSEQFWYTTGWGTRWQGCTLTYVPPCLTRTCLCSHPITVPGPSHLSQRFL